MCPAVGDVVAVCVVLSVARSVFCWLWQVFRINGDEAVVKLSCMLMPRYFAVLTFCRLCPCSWYDGTIFFFFRVAFNV